MDTVVKHRQGYGSTTLLYMTVLCYTAASARPLPFTNESLLDKPTVQYPNVTMEQDYGTEEHPRFRRDTATFRMNDEFANETTLPYERGNVRISNCKNARTLNGNAIVPVPSNISIPEGLIAITIDKGVAATVMCDKTSPITIPTGLVKRVADKGQCPTEKVACGTPTPSEDSLLRVCYKGAPTAGVKTECQWFAETRGKDKLVNAYITKWDDTVVCDTSVQFQYDVGKGKEPLPPGYMVLLKENEDKARGVKVSSSTGEKVSCSRRTEEGKDLETPYEEGKQVTVKLTKMGELLRIDCHTVHKDSARQVHTYFLLADGVPVVSCKEEAPACEVPAWLKGKLPQKKRTLKKVADGYECDIAVQVCYPSLRDVTLHRHCEEGEVDTTPLPAAGVVATTTPSSAGSGTTAAIVVGVVAVLLLIGGVIGYFVYQGQYKEKPGLRMQYTKKVMPDGTAYKEASVKRDSDEEESTEKGDLTPSDTLYNVPSIHNFSYKDQSGIGTGTVERPSLTAGGSAGGEATSKTAN